MRKTILSILFIGLALSATAATADNQTQTAPRKLGTHVARFLQEYESIVPAQRAKAFRQKDGSETLSLTLTCYDTQAAEKALTEMGVDFERVAPHAIAAELRPEQIAPIAALSAVKRVTGLKQRHLHLDKVRSFSKADDVHQGTELETPFTGKGVVVGIIDDGFLYTHPAFMTEADTTRILSVVNYARNSCANPINGSTAILRAGEDGEDEAHGTHVAGIAAAGSVPGSETHYGMAPEANLVFVTSNSFSDNEILKGIDLVKNTAEKLGAPYVVNMSFGTNYGSHDGSDELSQHLNELSKEGAILVSSAGNDGDANLHASFEFSDDATACYIVVSPNDADEIGMYLIGDDATAYDVKTYIYGTTTRAFTQRNDDWWTQNGSYFETYLDDNNNRQTFESYIDPEKVLSEFGNTKLMRIIFRVSGKAGHRIDAFLDGSGSVFQKLSNLDLPVASIDNTMTVGTPADTRNVIAVGAYVTKTTWNNIDGKKYGYSSAGSVGNLANFSSRGPSSDPDYPFKPEICAPGLGVSSPIKKSSDYSDNSGITEQITYKNKDYYYGVMQGTSQASPAVAGIVALWLQANPYLTFSQVKDILKETSTTDNFTKETWNANWGYGKINAYEGLKKALSLVGIRAAYNAEAPVTIQKGQGGWKFLFNSDESFADVRLYDLNGRQLHAEHLSQVKAGEDFSLSLEGMVPGIYVLKISTQNFAASRKLIVR